MSARSVTNDTFFVLNQWSSSNESVATIDENGIIFPHSEGETTITVFTTFRRYGLIEYGFNQFVLKVVSFEFEEDVNIDDSDSIQKALQKMTEYYLNNQEIKDVVDGNNPDCTTCIFAFEGLGDPSLKEEDIIDKRDEKVSKEHPFWRFMAMMVVTEGKKIKYITKKASTFPDRATSYSYSTSTRERGPTTLKEGVYSYTMGNHPNKSENRYVALRPTDDNRVAWYRNDGNFVCCESSGTNLHASLAAISDRYQNSTGCQVVNYRDYVAFGKAVGFLKDAEDEELKDIPLWTTGSFSAHFHNHLGEATGKFAKPISVKYVIDRTYDKTNNFYSNDTTFQLFAIELEILKQTNNPTEEEQNRINELERYLSYYETIDNSYKKGIFYPITKQCETSKCHIHKSEDQQND